MEKGRVSREQEMNFWDFHSIPVARDKCFLPWKLV
jgi:hypothetical protein